MDFDAQERRLMRKIFLLLCAFTAIVVQAQAYLDAFINASYFARRTITERGGSNKTRIELVYRWGNDKIVQVLSPVFLIWAKRSGIFLIGEPTNMKISPLEISDLEDLFIKALIEKGVSKVEREGTDYTIIVETGQEVYTAVITERGLPKKITRTSKGILTEMIYQTVEPLKDSFENIATRYGLTFHTEPIALPKEIKSVLENVLWYTVSRLKIGDEQVVMILANYKTGGLIKAVYSSREVTINTEPNEKVISCKGEGYYVYLITQDEAVYNELIATVSSGKE